MWATYVILNFLGATLKKRKKKQEKCILIFYFTQYIQNSIFPTGKQYKIINEIFYIPFSH